MTFRRPQCAGWKLTMVLVGISAVRPTRVPESSSGFSKKRQVPDTPASCPCCERHCRSQSGLGYHAEQTMWQSLRLGLISQPRKARGGARWLSGAALQQEGLITSVRCCVAAPGWLRAARVAGHGLWASMGHAAPSDCKGGSETWPSVGPATRILGEDPEASALVGQDGKLCSLIVLLTFHEARSQLQNFSPLCHRQ